MNTQGPYYLNPYGGYGQPQIDISYLIGQKGFIEIINLTNFSFVATFQSQGNVYQEPRSKVLYKAVGAQQGQQTLHLSSTVPQPLIVFPPNRLPPSLQNGANGQLAIWVNIYQEGEIEAYSPIPLSPPPVESSFYVTATIVTSGSLLIPTTSTYFRTLTGGTIIPDGSGTCDLLGFDLTSNAASASSGTLTISNISSVADGINHSIIYELAAPTTTPLAPLIIRWPTPIPNLVGSPGFNQPTFTIAGLTSGTHQLTVYYSLT